MRKTTVLATAMLVLSLMFTLYPMHVESQEAEPNSMINGTVYHNVTVDPIPGVLVRVYVGPISLQVVTDENGYYELPLQVALKEEYEIFASKEGFYDQWESGVISRGEVLTIDFALDPIPARIFGYVQDMETEEPIAYASIYVFTCESGEVWWTASSSGGFYEIYVETGSSVVYCEMSGYETYRSEDLMIEEGQELELNIYMVPIETGVFGTVKNDGGEAIQDAFVRVYNNYSYERFYSDEDGNYEILIPPGEYIFEVYADGYMDYEDIIEVPEEGMLEYDVVMEDITVTGMLRYILDFILEVIGGIF